MTVLSSTISALHAHTFEQNAPIGVFDSGVGGLSIAQEIIRYLPNERIIYFADTAHVPYGAREDEDIRQLTAQAVEWLYQQGCKAVVVACNTASAFSLSYLRQYYGHGFPIIGLVPALKPAVFQSKTKKVAVLATPATFRGKLIQDIVQNIAKPAQVDVLPITCLELVPLIEAGQHNSPKMHELLKTTLKSAVDEGVDCLVLGCTHYPFLKQAIQTVFPHQLLTLDSGLAVAKHTAFVLQHNGLSANDVAHDSIQIECYVSGGVTMALKAVLQQLISPEISWQVKPQMKCHLLPSAV